MVSVRPLRLFELRGWPRRSAAGFDGEAKGVQLVEAVPVKAQESLRELRGPARSFGAPLGKAQAGLASLLRPLPSAHAPARKAETGARDRRRSAERPRAGRAKLGKRAQSR